MAEHSLYGKRELCYTEVADFTAFQEIFYSPEGYNMEPLDNVFDKEGQGRKKCCMFYPAYLNYDDSCVDENGKLSAVASGDVTITATTADGSKTATCKVNVSKIIEFIDEGAKWWCMQFDTNEDGELTMGEAAAVEELPSYAFSYKNKYKENEDRPEITSFNEFQFFTSLKELGASAFESSGIEEICLPDNITYIGHDAFHSAGAGREDQQDRRRHFSHTPYRISHLSVSLRSERSGGRA